MPSRHASAKSRPGSSRPSIEYYMRPESRMSEIPKPEVHEGESKAHYAWRLIRQCVREAIDLSLKADIRDMVVNHGVHHSKKLVHAKPILQMLMNKTTNEYLTLDGEVLRVFHSDGRNKEVFRPDAPFNRLVHAYTQHIFIGWSEGESDLLLMSEDFNVQSQSQSQVPILAAIFNENIHEIVTVGPGYLTSWVFRYGGRHLLPRKTAEEGLTEKDRFNLVVLEETLSRSQKAFAACGTAVAVFNLHEGKLLQYKKELHTRNITSLMFFNPLKYLITGAKDGTIKVWNSTWHLQLVFVGHSAAVTSLCVYPYGPGILSSSKDNTIRVWSLETCDEVDLCETGEPVLYLNAFINNSHFFSIAANHADLWRVENVHTFHTRIGHRVNLLKATDHPEFPTRNVLLCKDASVRIVSPGTGDVLTTLLMPIKRILIDAAYAIAQERLFACFNNGDIVVADTTTNPCTILSEWKCSSPDKACNYLLMYEYVITADVGSDLWAGIKRMAGTKQAKLDDDSSTDGSQSSRSLPRTPKTPKTVASASTGSSANRTLLLGGRKDGHICVFNMQTGAIEFEIEAHGSRGVLSMIANSMADQLISAGVDNLIKIWRLYPYAQESLAPLMTLYCAHTPVFMCMLKSRLAVAFQDHSTATYSVVMYNLKNKNRQDHEAEHDHVDSITALTGCPKLRLLASCSHDGTIRIWNEMNNLVRIIRLNAVPHSLNFCSEKGDLLVGVADHLHKIDYKAYMPKSYRFKMISISFSDQSSEKALPYDENLVNHLSKEDQRRLKAARASFKFTHFVDILTEEETEEVMREKNQKQAAFNALAAREEELKKIAAGELAPSRPKLKPTAARKREAFDKYLKIFYNRPKPKLYQEEDYDREEKAKLLLEGPPPKVEAPWQPEKEPTGFFPAPSEMATKKPKPPQPVEIKEPTFVKEPTEVASTIPASAPPTPIRGDGYIPNSVLVKILFPREPTKDSLDRPLKTEWRPPKMSEDQLAQIAALSQKHFVPTSDEKTAEEEEFLATKREQKRAKKLDDQRYNREGTDRIMVLDWDTENEKNTPTPRDPIEEEAVDPDLEQEPNALLSRVQTLIEQDNEEAEENAEDVLEDLPSFTTPSPAYTRPSSGSKTHSPLGPRSLHQSPQPTPIAERSALDQLSIPRTGSGRSVEQTRVNSASSVSSLNGMPTWIRDDLARTPVTMVVDDEYAEEKERSETESPADSFFITGGGDETTTAVKEPESAEQTTSTKAGVSRPVKPTRQFVKYEKRPTPPPAAPASQPSASTVRSVARAPLSSHSPGSARSSSPPRPRTPLPEFITQFRGRDWFDKYFPNANENTMPKPWTVAAFITMLVRVLRIAEFEHKVDIMDGILSIYMSEGISVAEPIYKKPGHEIIARELKDVLYSVLNHHTHPPSCIVPVEKSFIRKAIELLQLLGTHDRDFFVEMMAQFLDGDKEVRQQVMEALNVAGLKDQHSYFKKELDGWDVWHIDDKDRQNELRKMCREWLERWMSSFKIHLEDALSRLKKGQPVHGRATPGTVSNSASRSSPAPPSAQTKGILKRPSLPGLIEEGDEATAQSEEPSRMATVTFDKAPELADLENATYIDAINYYCDMQLEKELEKMKTGGRLMDKSSGEEKNTVLVLPKIPGKATLVRLGETHTSTCRPRRETALSYDLRLPPITDRGHQPLPGQLYGFPKCISLPMKPVVLNPFPAMSDFDDPMYGLQQPVLLMLKTNQKYFVQERSLVVPDVIF